MLLKNVTYAPLEAVYGFEKFEKFGPLETKEIDDATAAIFLERYSVDPQGNPVLVKVEKPAVAEVIEEEATDEVETVSEDVAEEVAKKDNQFICSICGKVCKDKAGLSAHTRSHK